MAVPQPSPWPCLVPTARCPSLLPLQVPWPPRDAPWQGSPHPVASLGGDARTPAAGPAPQPPPCLRWRSPRRLRSGAEAEAGPDTSPGAHEVGGAREASVRVPAGEQGGGRGLPVSPFSGPHTGLWGALRSGSVSVPSSHGLPAEHQAEPAAPHCAARRGLGRHQVPLPRQVRWEQDRGTSRGTPAASGSWWGTCPQPCSAPCSLTLELHKHVSKDSGFWGDAGDTSQGAGPRSQALELPVAKITAPRQGPGQQVPKDISATEMRLVHLDLKGAAPKVSYLEQVKAPGTSQAGQGWAWLSPLTPAPGGASRLSLPCRPAALPTPVPAGRQRGPDRVRGHVPLQGRARSPQVSIRLQVSRGWC